MNRSIEDLQVGAVLPGRARVARIRGQDRGALAGGAGAVRGRGGHQQRRVGAGQAAQVADVGRAGDQGGVRAERGDGWAQPFPAAQLGDRHAPTVTVTPPGTHPGGTGSRTGRGQAAWSGGPRNRGAGQHGQAGRAEGVGPVPQRGRDRISLPDVLDGAEPVPLQQGRHVVRGQEREPRLAALRGRGCDQAGVGVAGVVAQGGGEDVVGDELRARREPADLRERLADRGPRSGTWSRRAS